MGTVTSWGYELDSQRDFVSWFKLSLSEEASERFANEQPQRFAQLDKILTKLRKEPVDVASDYLRCLWAHATEVIQRTIGKQLWENISIKIVLTLPAIWDHKAQELTRKAAGMAGLPARTGTTLELIGEPESAALAVFEEMGHLKKRGLKVTPSSMHLCFTDFLGWRFFRCV
jgi:molecular chaperone DnaK (HSP70)